MAKTAILKAEERKRTGSGLLKQMRKEGWVPSVVYGSGTENLNIKIDSKTFRELLGSSTSESFLVNLEMSDGSTQLAFLQDVQHDNLKGIVVHADFRAVDESTAITAHLPILLGGEPEGVKAGGLLEQHLHSLDVTCLPKDLPEMLQADVTALEIGDSLSVGDLELPEGLEVSLAPEVVVAIVAKTRTAKSEGVAGEEEEAADSEKEGE